MTLLNRNGEQRRMAAKLVLCCSLFFAQTTALLCQNLVPNPSFELIDSCPQYPALTGYQPGAIPENWYSTSNTPEYFNACIDTATGVPDNFFGHQFAFDGDAYSGMFSFWPGGYREMIGVELMTPLLVGQTYYASFYANAAYGGLQQTARACNNLGLLFCMTANYWDIGLQGPEFGLRNYAHVLSTSVITDTANWVLVSGSFVADSAYLFMVVGNHFNDANTTVDSLGPGYPWAYQFVDQFCVSLDPLGCPLVNGIDEEYVGQVVVFPNPARNSVRIDWKGSRVEHLRVVDLMGRLIWQEKVVGLQGATLDVSDWVRGGYILILEGGVRRSFKLVLVE